MKKNRTIIMLIISLIIAIIVICLFSFFMKVIKNKNEHISAISSTLGDKMWEKENLEMFTERIGEIKSIQSSVNDHFLNPNEVDKFVSYLEELGQKIGSEIIVENVEVAPKIKNTINFTVSIIGTFDEVIRTVSLLENIPYQVNITQLYLNKDIAKEIVKDDEDKEIKNSVNSKWQAGVTFNILTLE